MASQESEGREQAVAVEVLDNSIGQPACKKGGWSTVPFIIGSALASTVAIYGVTTDLMQFLDHRFSIKSIKASQITNIINSLMNLTPVAGALLCDSYLGCFLTISIFTFISFLGTLMITLVSVVPSLAPPSCDHALGSCQPPSMTQFALLCLAFAVVTLGAAGTSFTFVTVGANQFDKGKDQEVFVNWFFFTTTLAMLVSFTVVVYVLDNVGWGWGYGTCAVLNAISFALFVIGKWRYRDVRPRGSPLASLARVVVSTARKVNLELSKNDEVYYRGLGAQAQPLVPTSSFRFINKAALVTKGDTDSDGSIAKPWRLCTIEEVEDLKTLLKLLPLWSTGIFLTTATGIQTNLNILQSLTMDRSLNRHFKIPAASFQVFVFISMALFLPIIDRFFYPVWRTLTRQSPTILHRIGAGHIVNAVGLAAMAYVESRRLKMVHSHGLQSRPDLMVPMSALWLVPPLALIGAGSAFYIPGQVSLYYQEFPASLKNTGTSMMSLTMGIGFYFSTLVVDVLQKATGWLNDDINKGRLDHVFWMLAVLGGLNFLYYIACAKLYKLQSTR
ncbi:protein NRT1/ PTR FAMILY 2.7-like [Nymphaea colorata]|nr:protein NRT1/ PTR FAMILY 2.7-like [Nymphaea colorata]